MLPQRKHGLHTPQPPNGAGAISMPCGVRARGLALSMLQ